MNVEFALINSSTTNILAQIADPSDMSIHRYVVTFCNNGEKPTHVINRYRMIVESVTAEFAMDCDIKGELDWAFYGDISPNVAMAVMLAHTAI